MLIDPWSSRLVLCAVDVLFGITCTGLLVLLLAGDHARLIVVYGKTSSSSAGRRKTAIQTLLAHLQVPHSWFWTFYLLSTVLSVTSVCVVSHGRWGGWGSVLMLLHSVRRLCESLISGTSARKAASTDANAKRSTMFLGHLFAGWLFYLLTNTVYHAGRHLEPATDAWSLAIRVIAVVGFIAASSVQASVHRVLARTRAALRPGTYADVRKGALAYAICPHYGAEIVIYASIALAAGHIHALWPVLWTILMLTTSARQTDAWGRRAFTTWDKPRRRALLIPGLY